MTREELREHCEKQIRGCEYFARERGVEPSGKVYEEHKLILELLEQDSILNKIKSEIQNLRNCSCSCSDGIIDDVEDIIDKYKAETENT
jgi:hypothetical protein